MQLFRQLGDIFIFIIFVDILATAAAFTCSYIGETGRAFGLRLQEHRQEVEQSDVRAYTRSTSKSAATEQNKSAVTDHVISLNHVIDWDHAKVIDRQSNRMDRWIREAIYIRKEQDKSMNRNEGSYQLPHIYDYLLSATVTPGGQSFWRKQQWLPKRQQKTTDIFWWICQNLLSYVSTCKSVQRQVTSLF